MNCYVREIHIDAKKMPLRLIQRLESLGFFEDGFVRAGGGMECPPFHYTWQVRGSKMVTLREFSETWENIIEIVEGDQEFCGYIEAEIIPPVFHCELEYSRFIKNDQFPLTALTLVQPKKHKVSDLHIKIPLDILDSYIEEMMDMCGVYFVETPRRNRIYTLQFESHRDGRNTFRSMCDYFRKFGGATEITYELCPSFYRKPSGLDVPKCIKGGSPIYREMHEKR